MLYDNPKNTTFSSEIVQIIVLVVAIKLTKLMLPGVRSLGWTCSCAKI